MYKGLFKTPLIRKLNEPAYACWRHSSELFTEINGYVKINWINNQLSSSDGNETANLSADMTAFTLR